VFHVKGVLFKLIRTITAWNINLDIRTQWRRKRVCMHIPKSFDLSKIREKSVKIWTKSVKMLAKYLKIWANYLKI